MELSQQNQMSETESRHQRKRRYTANPTLCSVSTSVICNHRIDTIYTYLLLLAKQAVKQIMNISETCTSTASHSTPTITCMLIPVSVPVGSRAVHTHRGVDHGSRYRDVIHWRRHHACLAHTHQATMHRQHCTQVGWWQLHAEWVGSVHLH